MEFEVLEDSEASRLYELDRTHWLHPQGDLDAPAGRPAVDIRGGRGATPTMSTVAVSTAWSALECQRLATGEGARRRRATQMKQLAFSLGVRRFQHRTRDRARGQARRLAPSDLEVTYFASGGGGNDTA
jgi:hypothetical protein